MTFDDFRVNDNENLILCTDSYKYSHWNQLPSDVTALSEYLEARGGPFATSRFFGLQDIIIRHLLRPVTMEDVEEARALVPAHMGTDCFNEKGWRNLVVDHRGRLPIEIWAVPEGLDVPVRNVLMQIVNTDPRFAWLPTFLETLLQQVWAPTTVCTISAQVHRVFRAALERSSDDIAAKLPFAMQDFGCRGVPTMGTAALLGLANLVNGKGTDTVPALREARRAYGARAVAGYSIPAGEHTEILAWGKDGEEAYFVKLFDHYLKPGKIVAAPIDTYDMTHCLEHIICERLRERIRNSGGTYVARPDSGDPRKVVVWALRVLADHFGTTENAKGFLVLHPSVRVIFGDAMDLQRVEDTLRAVLAAGFSADNVTFGMGGGLLQKINRDIQRFAVKGSAIERSGTWYGMRKTVRSDPAKASKAGRLALVGDGARVQTVQLDDLSDRTNRLRPVYRNGELLVFQQWEDDVLATAATNDGHG
jgi:nicotinamide phosphoribosyltransferase